MLKGLFRQSRRVFSEFDVILSDSRRVTVNRTKPLEAMHYTAARSSRASICGHTCVRSRMHFSRIPGQDISRAAMEDCPAFKTPPPATEPNRSHQHQKSAFNRLLIAMHIPVLELAARAVTINLTSVSSVVQTRQSSLSTPSTTSTQPGPSVAVQHSPDAGTFTLSPASSPPSSAVLIDASFVNLAFEFGAMPDYTCSEWGHPPTSQSSMLTPRKMTRSLVIPLSTCFRRT